MYVVYICKHILRHRQLARGPGICEASDGVALRWLYCAPAQFMLSCIYTCMLLAGFYWLARWLVEADSELLIPTKGLTYNG
ncbi:MAG: hypothetical protein NVSMB44_42970 [Ktedonobacteraceae bacterium]